MNEIKKTLELGGRTLTLSTGKLAPQAGSAVLAEYGQTVVLATVVAGPLRQELDYFPLSVEYQERLYAGGRIKGSRWVKREGRPTDEEILKGRLIDRSIRPLFPKEYKMDVQVIATVISVDMENDPAVVAPIAVSAALHASSIPWMGPVSIVNVGLKDGKYFTNPLDSENVYSEMELTVSTTKEAIVMVEAGAKEVSEEAVLGGIEYAQKEGAKIIKFLDEFAKEVGRKKDGYEKKSPSADLLKTVKKLAEDKIPGIVESLSKVESGRSFEFEELVNAVKDAVKVEEKEFVLGILEDMKKKYIREMILKGKRTDGRKLDQIRTLASEVGILPRTHGSALFQRGATQALTVATLGSMSLGQLIETAEGEEEKRYIHHYVMAPFSTGETGKVGQPGRREIGHGALAERALMPVIPSTDVFPYAMRLVSEVLSSNGSTSMASTCGSTLALMDAGVPITSPVSGIAMGLIIESDKKYAVMSDIAGIEDFNGDMDFKVAGTSKGITAMQLDVKTLNLTLSIMKEALAQAKEGRAFILASMLKAIAEPRSKVSTYAPKVKGMKISPEKIGELIGPGGKVIKKLMADTQTQVDVEDDGSVSVSGIAEEGVLKAIEWIEGLVKEVQPGEIYEGVVKRIQPFGAFVEILPGKDGLVHVSDMADEFVSNPEDVVTLDQKVQVRVKEIDGMGRINLSMRMDASKDKPRTSGGDRGGRSGGGFSRGGGSDRGRGGFGGNRGGGDRGGRGFAPRGGARFGGERNDRGGSSDRGRRESSSGPHFPTSRLIDNDASKKRYGR